eukprot:1159697-Pelagomonas_calceolata.AAC.6
MPDPLPLALVHPLPAFLPLLPALPLVHCQAECAACRGEVADPLLHLTLLRQLLPLPFPQMHRRERHYLYPQPVRRAQHHCCCYSGWHPTSPGPRASAAAAAGAAAAGARAGKIRRGLRVPLRRQGGLRTQTRVHRVQELFDILACCVQMAWLWLQCDFLPLHATRINYDEVMNSYNLNKHAHPMGTSAPL